MLRSCYKTTIRPFKDSDQEATIQWYFVPRGTPSLPFPTVFGSRNWEDREETWGAPGEVQGAARPWVNGAKPFVAKNATPVGPPEWFQEGAPISAAGSLPRDWQGAPKACTGEPKNSVTNGIGFLSWQEMLLGFPMLPQLFVIRQRFLIDLLGPIIQANLPTNLKIAPLKSLPPLSFDNLVFSDFDLSDFNGAPEPQDFATSWVLSDITDVDGVHDKLLMPSTPNLWQVNSSPAVNPQLLQGLVIFDPTSLVVYWWGPADDSGYAVPMNTSGDQFDAVFRQIFG